MFFFCFILQSQRPAEGITGNIQFDYFYKTRNEFTMEIVELEKPENVFKKIAEWSAFQRLKVTRSFEELLSQKAATIQNKVFTVVSKLGMPYLEMASTTDDKPLTGNDQYEGFVKDLMDEIAKVKNFKYKLVLVPDNHIGTHDPVTGKWSGMIGEILEGVSLSYHRYLNEIFLIDSFFFSFVIIVGREPI